MIYLADRKILFLKPKKVAGTSFEIALSTQSRSQSDDIITALNPLEDVNRKRLGGALPTNWAMDVKDDQAYREKVDEIDQHLGPDGSIEDRATNRLVARCRRWLRSAEARFRSHTPPSLVRERLGDERFDAATKVTIVREPLEQLISRVFFILKTDGGFEIGDAEWTAAVEDSLKASNEGYYLKKRRRICDVYLRYEHLSDDLAAFDSRFGTDLAGRMPRTKHRARTDRRPPEEVLTRDQIRRCVRNNRGIYREFGYPIPAGA